MSDPVQAAPAAPSTSRRRILMLALVAAVVVIAAAGAYAIHLSQVRQRGIDRYHAVVAQQAAAGLGAGPADLLRGAPVVDPTRLADFARWEDDAVSASWPGGLDKVWPNAMTEMPAASLTAVLADAATGLDRLAALLGDGRLAISGLAYMANSIPDPEHAPWVKFQTVRSPRLIGLRAAARGFAIRSLVAADPAPALADLDRLVVAMDHPGTIIDAMIAVHIRHIRDEIHLALARAGRLSHDELVRWSAEEDCLRLVTAGFRGERLWTIAPLARAMADGTFAAEAGGAEDYGGMSFPGANWVHGPGDMAECLALLGDMEQALGDGRPPEPMPAEVAAALAGHGTIASIATPDLSESIPSALTSANQHRIHVLAATVLVAWHQSHGLPADEAACLAMAPPGVGDPGPVRFRLRYERLAPDRFRIAADPAGIPALWVAAMATRAAQQSDFGRAVVSAQHLPAQVIKPLSIELGLGGR